MEYFKHKTMLNITFSNLSIIIYQHQSCKRMTTVSKIHSPSLFYYTCYPQSLKVSIHQNMTQVSWNKSVCIISIGNESDCKYIDLIKKYFENKSAEMGNFYDVYQDELGNKMQSKLLFCGKSCYRNARKYLLDVLVDPSVYRL